MPPYSHLFTQTESSPAAALYRADGFCVRVDFLSERLLRVAAVPDGARLLPTWSVQPGEPAPREGRERLSLEGFPLFAPERENAFSFVWGEYALSFTPENLLLSLTRGGKPLLKERAPLAVNMGGEFGRGQTHYLVREEGERIYGLGDKSGNLDKSGRRFRLDSTDAMGYDAETSDPLYKHVPFYICQNSTGCVGVFYDTHASCAFDFGEEISNYTGPYRRFSTGDEALVYYVLLGTMAEIVTAFSRLTGGCAFPPRCALLYWGSTMAYTDAADADAQLKAFADACLKKRFSCGGFYLSSGYTSIGERRYVFHWNNEKIPDPRGLSAYFKARGMEIMANVKPVFLTSHPLYETIAQNGWFLSTPDGTPALTPFWDGLGSFLDFTNPGAYDFWKKQVTDELLQNGIACTWNDNNEYEVLDERVLADNFGAPVPACRIKPVFAMLMTRASLEAQQSFFGENARPHISCRAGAAGVCRMAETWTGDNRTAWKTLRYNHKMGLTMSLSGLYLFGHDIGGFAGGAPERELFLRWLQHGAFTPRFVVHSWNDDGRATTPWFYPDAEDAVREIFAFRQRLLPYLYDTLYRAHAYSEPILRPLVYTDPAADPESDLFFVGNDLLAACVFDKGGDTLLARLPAREGGWYRPDGRWFPGGKEAALSCPPEGEPTVLFGGGSAVLEDAAPYLSGNCEHRLTICAQERGELTREYFDDDGETYAFRGGGCARLVVTARFLPEEVRIRIQNRGARTINPSVRLLDRFGRKLVWEEAAI